MRYWLVLMVFVVQGVGAWPQGIPQPLSGSDASHYKALFAAAEKGRWEKTHAGAVKDDVLLPHAKAALYQSKGYKASYGELTGWLEKYPAYPEAAEVYRLANIKRPKPTTTCKTTKVKVKGKKKLQKKRTCTTTGSWGPEAPLPWSIQKRKMAQDAADRAREQEYAGMGPERAAARREVLGQSWRLRNAKKWDAALELLNRTGTRRMMGDERWQGELVQIADAQQVSQNWKVMHRAGMLGAKAQGPVRDDALWWAGFGAYRLGDYREAVDAWEELVRIEPEHGTHAARGAYWAGRAYEKLGNRERANRMYQQAARDPVAYYGILAAKKLGETPRLDWTAPRLNADDVKAVLRVDSAKRALALVQVGQVSTGQMALRTADEDIPTAYTETMAALGLELHMPAVALQMGKALYPNQIRPAMLFPLAEEWKPRGPVVMERPLLLAITRQESAFHPTIGSHVGAQGLMQLMPPTARYIVNKTGRGSASNLHDPINNMTLGHDYLAYLQGKTEGDLIAMIAAYNAGLGNVNKWKRREIAPASDPALFVESIPFDETRGYVQKVLANLWIYESRLGKSSWSLTSLARNQWPQRWVAVAPDERDIGG
ncbi:MAG: transglycosylase SLT domain-containing protein [Alphaproteobacteria bacterium]